MLGKARRSRMFVLLGMLALLAVTVPAAAQTTPQDPPTLSVSDRLDDRRYVAAGSRGYIVGAETGRFPAMGWHIQGEMGGIWSPPIKLLDGLWFGVDGEWLGEATRFTSGYGFVQMEVPGPDGLTVKRTDFLPDGKRGALVGLELTSPTSRQVNLTVDAHSELMSAYPWGWTNPSALEHNLEDTVAYADGRLEFREQGKPPVENAETHDWAAVVGSQLTPTGHATGEDFRGPQDPAVICPPEPWPEETCDDGQFGKGAGGQLNYDVTLEAGKPHTVWIAVAGSEQGPADARGELDSLLADPEDALKDKISERLALQQKTQLDIPGDRQLEDSIDWSKQNLADSVQVAEDLEIRETNAGVNYPPPEGTIDEVRFLGAGFPDYPWLFGTDGEFTAFASVGVGQFEPIKDHLRALRDASLIDNSDSDDRFSGKVVHEVMTDGSIYFGSNADPGNTDETAKFPSAVALIWRWTGDNAFRDEMYGFSKSNMEYIFRELDDDKDGWPEGLGNVEREGMGEEKLDVTTSTIRGLYDLADMAKSKGDTKTFVWAMGRANRMMHAFEASWWMAEVPQHADSLDDPGNVKVQQRHWIGVTPMEVELVLNNQPVPGLTTFEHGDAALSLRETECYSEDFGLYHTGAPGCDPAQSDRPAEKSIFTLNTAVMAVGEGNYGRLGPDQQQRFTTANAMLQFMPDEQPGAMPEIAPSPDYGRSINRGFTDRAMVLQAWGAYGTIWPVVHQQLGVRPDMGRRALEVTPQVPPQSPEGLSGENIRLGSGFVDVSVSASDGTYRTTVVPNVVSLKKLIIGHTVPRDAEVVSVTLDGNAVPYEVRSTNRGKEVLVEAAPDVEHTLMVEAQ